MSVGPMRLRRYYGGSQWSREFFVAATLSGKPSCPKPASIARCRRVRSLKRSSWARAPSGGAPSKSTNGLKLASRADRHRDARVRPAPEVG